MLPPSAIISYSSKKSFSRRESEILEMVVAGATNGQIGAELNLREQVVKNYMKGMFDKSGIKNRVCLVADVYDWYLASKGYLQWQEFRAQFEQWMQLRETAKRNMGLTNGSNTQIAHGTL